MSSLLKTRVSPHQVAEILCAIVIVLWRILACPTGNLWRDWCTILAVYWLLAVMLSGRKALIPVTAAFGAFLMGLYVWGHLPHAAAFLGTVP